MFIDMKKTQRHEHTEKNTISYVINSGISDKLARKVEKMQKVLKAEFGDIIWLLPKDALHITLMDWLAPFVDYQGHPDELFDKLKEEYIGVLKTVLQDQKSIQVYFNIVKVSPTTIIIQGKDDGSYAQIRKKFLEKIDLLPGTKFPPGIVHASIARFAGEDDMQKAEEIVPKLSIDLTETVKEFRLVRETKLPMLEYEVLERFKLK